MAETYYDTPRISVLITGAGAPTGMSILKALRHSKYPLRLIATDAEPLSSGLFLADAGYTLPSAVASAEAYYSRLAEICVRMQVRLVFFGSDIEMRTMGPRRMAFERETRSLLVLNSPFLLETFGDKWRTYQVLSEKDIPVPDSVLPSDKEAFASFLRRNAFPLIVKPRMSAGSKNLFTVRCEKELRFFCSYVPDPIVQEYLLPDDEEYTVGMYKSRRSQSVHTLIFKRTLAAGLTYKAQVVVDEEIDAVCRNVAQSFDMWGPCNVQLRKTPQGVRIFEVNLRFSSSVVMRAYFGLNEPELCIEDLLLEQALTPVMRTSGYALRYWDEVYVEEEVVSEIQKNGSLVRPVVDTLSACYR